MTLQSFRFRVRLKQHIHRLVASIVVLAFLPGLSGVCLAKDATSNLPPRYRTWLQREVVYIINSVERDAFLKLPSDAARDEFIERFWEVRNPTPGAPNNPYKEEHYARVEYANQYFGHASHTEGWRTDMGRIYITLGPPQQRQREVTAQKTRPMEIWFYQSTSPALPPYFYVVFYQKDAASEFKLYSPYSNGPEELIQAIVGPTRQDALKTIQDELGREVARISLSLLPDEPVDWTGGQISLQSDVMLNTIRNLPNHPFVKDQIAQRGKLLESVTHRVILSGDYLDVLTVPLRDAQGQMNLHYVLRVKRPGDFSVGQTKDGYYYNADVLVHVFGPEGRLIFSQERKLSQNINPKQFEQIKGRIFGYESVLPLAPGKYKLDFLLTDGLKHTSFRQDKEVTIPDPAQDAMYMTNLVAFSGTQPLSAEKTGLTPFSSAGVKFIPAVGQELDFSQDRDLTVFYQVWVPPAQLHANNASRKFAVEYLYGRMGAHDNKTISDEIGVEQFDAGGSLINGKKIHTGELPVGNYRLVVTLRDPASQKKAFGSLDFRVVPKEGGVAGAWDATDQEIAEDLRSGMNDYWRGLSYRGQGDQQNALQCFARAFDKDASNERFLGSLVELHFARKDFSEIVKLYARHGITEQTDEQTMLRIAESLEQTGSLRKAIQLLESAVALKKGDGPLYLALAGYYRRAGDSEKAAQAERRGRELSSATTPSSL